jgi:hypothetical protein
VLEAFSSGHWQAAASAQTNALGRATWKYRLQPGLYRLRARSGGTLSRALAVTVS